MKGKYGEPWGISEADDMVLTQNADDDSRYCFHAETKKIYGPAFWVESEINLRHDALKRAVLCVNLCDGLTSEQIAEAVADYKKKVGE